MLLLGSMQAEASFFWVRASRGSHQLNPDPKRCLLFEKKACKSSLPGMDLSESTFRAIQKEECVCHGRPAGLHTYVPLVAVSGRSPRVSIDDYCPARP